MAEVLSKAGYETRGGSRNAWITKSRGFARGFDEFDDRDHAQLFEEDFNIRESIRRHADTNAARRYARILADALTCGQPVRGLANLVYFTYRDSAYSDDGANVNNAFAERTVNEADEPWFLFLNYMEAHEPYYQKRAHDETFLPDEVPPVSAYDESAKWNYHSGRTNPPFSALESMYEAEIRLLDDRVGHLLDMLERKGVLDEMLVILVGDHGQHFGEHGLMAHIASPYPEAIRVPLLISEPGQRNAQTISEPTSLRRVYDVVLEQATDHEYDPSNPVVSHCFGTHEDVFDDYPELDEDAWREHLVTAILDCDGQKYGVVRGDRGRQEIYDMSNPAGPNPDIEIDDDLESHLDDTLGRMEAERVNGSNEAVSDHLKDLGYL